MSKSYSDEQLGQMPLVVCALLLLTDESDIHCEECGGVVLPRGLAEVFINAIIP